MPSTIGHRRARPRRPCSDHFTCSARPSIRWARISPAPWKARRCWSPARYRRLAAKPLAGAVVDVWHSDNDGYYDVQQLDEIGELAMRARFRTDENGRFWFWSIRPAAYPIPHDGPVGKMLEAQGRHPWRPAHVHFMISAPGHQTLVTHVFAAGDQYLDSDVVFGVKDSLIREFAGMPAGTAARWPRDGAALLSSELRFRTEGGNGNAPRRRARRLALTPRPPPPRDPRPARSHRAARRRRRRA